MDKQKDFAKAAAAVDQAAAQMDEFDRQLEDRISAMEKSGYEFPTPFSRLDYICVAVVSAVCLFMIILGGIAL